MEINLEKIKGFTVVTAFITIGGAIIPSFLFLYIYKRDLFLTLDLYRLTLIAISLGSPILIINIAMTFVRIHGDKMETNKQDTQFHKAFITAMYLGGLLSSWVIWISIIVGYYYSRDIKDGVFSLLIGEALTIVSYLIVVKRLNRKK